MGFGRIVPAENGNGLVVQEFDLEQMKDEREEQTRALAEKESKLHLSELDGSTPEEALQERNRQVEAKDVLRDTPASVALRQVDGEDGVVRLVTSEPTPTPVDTPVEDEEPVEGKPEAESKLEDEGDEEHVCPECGRVCKSDLGLRSHLRSHRKDED